MVRVVRVVALISINFDYSKSHDGSNGIFESVVWIPEHTLEYSLTPFKWVKHKLIN